MHCNLSDIFWKHFAQKNFKIMYQYLAPSLNQKYSCPSQSWEKCLPPKYFLMKVQIIPKKFYLMSIFFCIPGCSHLVILLCLITYFTKTLKSALLLYLFYWYFLRKSFLLQCCASEHSVLRLPVINKTWAEELTVVLMVIIHFMCIDTRKVYSPCINYLSNNQFR